MKTYTYTVHIHPTEQGGFWIEVPALTGCLTEGETVDEVLSNAQEAIELHLEGLQEEGLPIPEEERPQTDQVVVMSVAVPAAV